MVHIHLDYICRCHNLTPRPLHDRYKENFQNNLHPCSCKGGLWCRSRVLFHNNTHNNYEASNFCVNQKRETFRIIHAEQDYICRCHNLTPRPLHDRYKENFQNNLHPCSCKGGLWCRSRVLFHNNTHNNYEASNFCVNQKRETFRIIHAEQSQRSVAGSLRHERSFQTVAGVVSGRAWCMGRGCGHRARRTA